MSRQSIADIMVTQGASSLGTNDRMVKAVDNEGNAQTTSTTEYREFFMPADRRCDSALILIGDPRPSVPGDYHHLYENFLWCEVDPGVDADAVIGGFNCLGKGARVSIEPGQSLGFFKSSTADKSVILWSRE